jgi:phage gp36-like protein
MGQYATITSISNLLPDFLDGNTTTADKIGVDCFSACIEKAEAMFNAAVSNRYSLPFQTTPPLATSVCFDMAAYYAIRALGSRDWPNRNEWLDDFKTAFDVLEKISKGEMYLVDTNGDLVGRRSMMATNRENEGAIFDVDEPDAWRVDSDRLEDLEGSRD